MQSCFINALSVCLSVCLSLFPCFFLPYVACFPQHRGRDLEHCTLFILCPLFFLHQKLVLCTCLGFNMKRHRSLDDAAC